MPSHPSLLVVSHELLVRKTYAKLFRRAGYIAEEAEPIFSVARLKAGGVGILVMDHTLSRDVKQALIGCVRLLSPDTKTVTLHASAKDCGADLVIDSREGAPAILQRVAALGAKIFPSGLFGPFFFWSISPPVA